MSRKTKQNETKKQGIPGKRRSRYDWEYFRDKYVMGDDKVTLEWLSEQPGAPSFHRLKMHCMEELWVEQRNNYRNQVATKTKELSSTNEAQLSARHVKISQAMQAKALQRLAQLDPSELTPGELRAYLRDAMDIERKALGIEETLRIRGEMKHSLEAEIRTYVLLPDNGRDDGD